MREIFVTNHNDFHHSDKFDGVDYDFPPKERVPVPIDAAVHMFGFNMPDKTETLTRLGWAVLYDPKTKQYADDPEGVKKLARFVFTKAVMVEERIEVIEQPGGEPIEGREIDANNRQLPKGSIPFLRKDALEKDALV